MRRANTARSLDIPQPRVHNTGRETEAWSMVANTACGAPSDGETV